MRFLFRIFKYQLYLLQLENYEPGRYFRLLLKKGFWPKGPQRKALVWTGKATVVFFVAVLLYLILPFLIVVLLFGGLPKFRLPYPELLLVLIPAYLIFYFLFSFFYALALFLLWPFDYAAKMIIVNRAKAKIHSLQWPVDSGPPAPAKGGLVASGMTKEGGLKIIGIAGSYGKTTMKEVLSKVLAAKFKVIATPESVNTPVGVARWILKRASEDTEVVLVEMGEHYRGDVAYLCGLAQPDIALVTGINEAHLERMKNMDNVVDTIFEVVSSAKPGAMVILNADDDRVMENYHKYVWPDHKVGNFSAKGGSAFGGQFSKFNVEDLSWETEIAELGKTKINLLGQYAFGDVDAAIIIARRLGMNDEEIKRGIANIKPVEHRLQPIKTPGNILVIDDSYNGNPAGAKEAIQVLARFENRRKVYVTPGLVEMGEAAANIHKEIGRQLAEVADVVILIRDSVTPFILEGINGIIKNQASRAKPEIIWFDTAREAHESLGEILKPNDVVLFQNDWGDQYL